MQTETSIQRQRVAHRELAAHTQIIGIVARRQQVQTIHRTAHQRRVHEAQRQVQAAAEREQLRAVIHSHVR